MSVRIRLTRTGRKNLPLWRIAVFDKLTRRDGKYLEMLGTYDPREEVGKKIKLDLPRYDHWVQNGALPSDSLARILKHAGVVGKK
jgi:small subunit ribosomal protein S16